MAKDNFQRKKPHVNVCVMNGLEKLGFSALGTHQVATGQIVTDPADRALTAAILGEVHVHHSPGREEVYFTITLTRANAMSSQGWGKWELSLQPRSPAAQTGGPIGKRQHKAPTYTAAEPSRLKELGFTDRGAGQIATGQMMTEPGDRSLAAEILAVVNAPLTARSLCNNEVIK